jgi:SAM-dependent methyltransferase
MVLGTRTSIIRSLLPTHSERMLDVGCGPIASDYPYADKALRVTCIDWRLTISGPLPSNVEYLDADFTSIDLAPNTYDSIVAADVFEHITLEQEAVFVDKCVAALRRGGTMVVSVPHQGTFALLDPYQVRPTIHRMLARIGLYKRIHNGCCDIRKGHKHYILQELTKAFSPLRVSQVVYFGYMFDPLLSWAVSLSRVFGRTPSWLWLRRACQRELDHDFGQRSFNIAASFYKS